MHHKSHLFDFYLPLPEAPCSWGSGRARDPNTLCETPRKTGNVFKRPPSTVGQGVSRGHFGDFGPGRANRSNVWRSRPRHIRPSTERIRLDTNPVKRTRVTHVKRVHPVHRVMRCDIIAIFAFSVTISQLRWMVMTNVSTSIKAPSASLTPTHHRQLRTNRFHERLTPQVKSWAVTNHCLVIAFRSLHNSLFHAVSFLQILHALAEEKKADTQLLRLMLDLLQLGLTKKTQRILFRVLGFSKRRQRHLFFCQALVMASNVDVSQLNFCSLFPPVPSWIHHLASCCSGWLTSKAASLCLERILRYKKTGTSNGHLVEFWQKPLPCHACTSCSSDWT